MVTKKQLVHHCYMQRFYEVGYYIVLCN
jgi:hypothetical protein